MPASKQKVAIAELLRGEGFISSFETRALGSPDQRMRIVLKYGGKGGTTSFKDSSVFRSLVFVFIVPLKKCPEYTVDLVWR